MPNQIAVIGDSDFILGFKALGCALYSVDEEADLRKLFDGVIKDNPLCIFILEDYAAKILDLIGQYSQASQPMIIALPDFRKDLSLSEDLLSRMAIRAIGQDIIKGA
jgi:vacuolar-type H+-ATPase subunit F/Vma7